MYIVMYLENKNKSILLAIGELRVYMDLRVYDKTLRIRVRCVCKTCTGMVSLGPTHTVPVRNLVPAGLMGFRRTIELGVRYS
jgi:hypothetical protein